MSFDANERLSAVECVDHVAYSTVEIIWLMSTASCIVQKSFGLPSTAIRVILMRCHLLA